MHAETHRALGAQYKAISLLRRLFSIRTEKPQSMQPSPVHNPLSQTCWLMLGRRNAIRVRTRHTLRSGGVSLVQRPDAETRRRGNVRCVDACDKGGEEGR